MKNQYFTKNKILYLIILCLATSTASLATLAFFQSKSSLPHRSDDKPNEAPKRTYRVNVSLGVATESCFLICETNGKEAVARELPKCYAQDQSLISEEEFASYLAKNGANVSIVSQGGDEKFLLSDQEIGRLSYYAACHYRPTVVEVKSGDECDAPLAERQGLRNCQVESIEAVIVDKVQEVEFVPGTNLIGNFLGGAAWITEYILNGTGVRKYNNHICADISKRFYTRRFMNEFDVSRKEALQSSSPPILYHIHNSKLSEIGKSSLVTIVPSDLFISHRLLEQYNRGLNEKIPLLLGTSKIIRCSYGGYSNNYDLRLALLQYKARDTASVKKLITQ